MLTGVEIVGVVLASLPLLISALEHYRKGVEPIQTWCRYHHELKSLKKTINIERVKLLNSCENLLINICPVYEVGQLINHPRGIEWKNKKLDMKLRRFLGTSFDAFCDILHEFEEKINELVAKLDVDSEGKPQWSNKESFERALHRIKFSLSREKRNQLKTKLRQLNEDLVAITGASLELAPSRRRSLKMKEFDDIRKDACSVHEALEKGPWNCKCKLPHNANLRLDALEIPEGQVPGASTSSLVHRFRFIFSFSTESTSVEMPPWNWREADIVPLECDQTLEDCKSTCETSSFFSHGDDPGLVSDNTSILVRSRKKLKKKKVKWGVVEGGPKIPLQVISQPTPPTPMVDIKFLCSTLQKVCEGSPCLGFLKDDKRNKRLGIFPIKAHPRSTISTPTNLVRLSEILSNTHESSSTLPDILTRKDRLRLAVIMASTALQLHPSPWLDQSWGKKDIIFLRTVDGIRNPIIEQPYISRSFSSSTASSSPANISLQKFGPMIRNKSLLDLGILLIELCLNQPLETFRKKEHLGPDENPNDYTDYMTAKSLVNRIYNEGGTRYGDAVRRCIHCDFDQIDESLDSEDFRQAVYSKVVLPLEEGLRDFPKAHLYDRLK